MKPTSGAFTMPRLSQACLLGYTPSPQQAFQGDAAHQAQRRTWLTPKDSSGTWYTWRDYRSRWILRPFHRTVFTAHTWSALPASVTRSVPNNGAGRSVPYPTSARATWAIWRIEPDDTCVPCRVNPHSYSLSGDRRSCSEGVLYLRKSP